MPRTGGAVSSGMPITAVAIFSGSGNGAGATPTGSFSVKRHSAWRTFYLSPRWVFPKIYGYKRKFLIPGTIFLLLAFLFNNKEKKKMSFKRYCDENFKG
jgi:hypothetical protein